MSSNIQQAVGQDTYRDGFGTVTPYLIVDTISPFVEFLEKAFGGKETLREQGNGGGWHCEVQIGNSHIMIGGDQPKKKDESEASNATASSSNSGVTLLLYVANVDEVYKAAVEAGAKIEMELMDGFAGPTARGASIIDPFGNTWYLAQETKK